MLRARHLSKPDPSAQKHNEDTDLQWQGARGISTQHPNPFFGDKVVLNAQTVRKTIIIHAPGERLKLRISNTFGVQPIHIGDGSTFRH